MNEVVISILTYNKLEYTKKCLEKLFENTVMPYHRIVVTDNNSTDGTVKWLKSLDNKIRLIENEENQGFAQAHNFIMNEYPKHDVVLMNNDIEVEWKWLMVLQDGLQGNIGAVSPCIKTPGGLDVGAVLDKQARGKSLINDFKTEPTWITGSCLYLCRETIDLVGLLDPNFKFYYEDVDYCVRMKKLGIGFKCISDVVVVHHNSVSSTPELKKRMLEESRQYFMKKHNWGA